MFSIYTSVFNLVKNRYDCYDAVKNFSQFADEVVICLNQSTDNSDEILKRCADNFQNVKIIKTDYKLDDPFIIGNTKDAALQNTTKPIKIGLDIDERLPLWQKPLWLNCAQALINSNFLACFIPSLNLYNSITTVSDDYTTTASQKWYMHKPGLKRGPVNFGKLPDGTINTHLSDSTELINKDGNLVHSHHILGKMDNLCSFLKVLRNTPFVYHLALADLDHKEFLYHGYAKEYWNALSGGRVPAYVINAEEMKKRKTIYHNLPLWMEGTKYD
jgi:glycosyltransferase involved in cell wall biosynthesis